VTDLSPPAVAVERSEALRRRSRIVHAACVTAASEAAARLFTMSRAYDASDRSIARQQTQLRKLQQEAITLIAHPHQPRLVVDHQGADT